MEAETSKWEARVGNGEGEDGGWRMEDRGGVASEGGLAAVAWRASHQLSVAIVVRWKVAEAGSGSVLMRQ
jgi:hypothetical protein